MKRIAALVWICVLLTGCAGQQTKLGNDDRTALATQPLHAVDYGPHLRFNIESTGYTTAAVLFTPLVVLAQGAEGNALKEDLKLEDPARRVKDRLVRGLQANFNITDVRAAERPAQNDPETLRKTFGSGILLEVHTRKWGLDNNRAKYSANARLTRLSDAKVLWEAACNDVVADKDKPSPSRDALRANDGELLKAKLNEAADACADQLVAWAAGKDR